METSNVDVPILESVTYIAKLNKFQQEVFLYYSISKNFRDFNHTKVQLLILYPYMGVPQTVHIYKSGSLSD
jgi:hypothetical protein